MTPVPQVSATQALSMLQLKNQQLFFQIENIENMKDPLFFWPAQKAEKMGEAGRIVSGKYSRSKIAEIVLQNSEMYLQVEILLKKRYID